MKVLIRILKESFTCLVIAIVIAILLLSLLAYLDVKNCLCATLTKEMRTYQIDEQLSRVVEPESINSGTFAIITTHCNHRVRMRLIIDQDTGTYRGCLLDGSD